MLREDREGQKRRRNEEEDDGERSEENRKRLFIRRAASLGAFDHLNHLFDEGFARIAFDPHNDPVGKNSGAARDGREVAARLADYRRGFARHRGFVDARNAGDDFAVARDHVARTNNHDVALSQGRALHVFGGNVGTERPDIGKRPGGIHRLMRDRALR